jgi:hypothetical protein
VSPKLLREDVSNQHAYGNRLLLLPRIKILSKLMPAPIIFTSPEIEWLQSLMKTYFEKLPQDRDPEELAWQAEVLTRIDAADTITPTACTLSQQDNEWLQNVVVWYMNTLMVVWTETEMDFQTSVMAKLQSGDTL